MFGSMTQASPDCPVCGAVDASPGAGSSTALRVLVVDDNQGFAAALQNTLVAWGSVQVLGIASDGRAALECAASLRPDLVLMDIAMPGMDGLSAARRMRGWSEPPRIVLMSLNDGAAYRAAAASLGDVGFVDKGDILVELAPLVALMVADKVAGPGSQDRGPAPDGLHDGTRAADKRKSR